MLTPVCRVWLGGCMHARQEVSETFTLYIFAPMTHISDVCRCHGFRLAIGKSMLNRGALPCSPWWRTCWRTTQMAAPWPPCCTSTAPQSSDWKVRWAPLQHWPHPAGVTNHTCEHERIKALMCTNTCTKLTAKVYSLRWEQRPDFQAEFQNTRILLSPSCLNIWKNWSYYRSLL